MPIGPSLNLNRDNLFWLTFAAAVFLVLGKSVFLGAGLHENFASKGNDDIMRLTVVRDLIAGQSWFDTTQYRMVPPEGLSLHWSRYIDAGIAAIILSLSIFFEMDMAEQLAAVVWPTLILLLTLIVVGFGTGKVFGRPAACFAMLCLVFWPLTADVHVRPGNLDHHNVQFLMTITMIFGIIWPGRAAQASVVAGLAAAFSLAVGLESILFIVVAGLVLVVQAAFGVGRMRLVGFCVTLAFFSVLLWLGQAAPSTRFIPVCDQLGTPILALVGVASGASLLSMIILRSVYRPIILLAITAGIVAIGLIVVWPLLEHCISGPYGNLPDVLQTHISTSIVEALPAVAYVKHALVPALVFLIPVLIALIMGAAIWFIERGEYPDQQHKALGVLLVFGLFGVAMVFYQMRTVIMVATVVPMIGGVVMAHMLAKYLKSRDAVSGLLMLAVQIAIIAPTLLVTSLEPLLPNSGDSNASSEPKCQSYAALKSLNSVPPALILSHGNLGASIIWATHHDALSAPYHRSAEALGNGFLPFQMESEEMAEYVRATGATYLLLCRDQKYTGAFATALAAGGQADWLKQVPLDDENQMLFTVLRE